MIATPTDLSNVNQIMTNNEYLKNIYYLLVIIAVCTVAMFIHRLLRNTFKMLRGDNKNDN